MSESESLRHYYRVFNARQPHGTRDLDRDGIARFPTEGPFLSYSRVVPGADNSGGRIRHRSGTKAGNRYLKLAFSHASVRAIQYFPVIKAFYQKQRRRKPVIVARAIVAAERARIVIRG